MNNPALREVQSSSTIQVSYKLEKETPGTVRYQEVDDSGNKKDPAEAVCPTVYVRKSALPKPYPKTMSATFTF